MVKQLAVLALAALAAVGCGCEQIEATSVGVTKNAGDVVEVKPPGMYFEGPFTQIVEVPMTLRSINADVNASSYDLQRVETKVTVQYGLERNDALLMSMFRSIGEDVAAVDALLLPAIQESVKGVTAKYRAAELLEKREQVKQQTDDALTAFIRQTMSAKGLDGLVKIANVAIVDFSFSKEYNDAIEAKVRADQDMQRAVAEKTKRTTDAEARASEVTHAADAEAYRQRAAADASAYAVSKAAEAKEAAIKRVAGSLGGPAAYLRLKWIEQWGGALPRVTTATAPTLMIGGAE